MRREVLDKGEAKRGYGAFEEDLYGAGEFLWGKRVARRWRRERGRELWNASMGRCFQTSGDALVCLCSRWETSPEMSEMLSCRSMSFWEWNY